MYLCISQFKLYRNKAMFYSVNFEDTLAVAELSTIISF